MTNDIAYWRSLDLVFGYLFFAVAPILNKLKGGSEDLQYLKNKGYT